MNIMFILSPLRYEQYPQGFRDVWQLQLLLKAGSRFLQTKTRNFLCVQIHMYVNTNAHVYVCMYTEAKVNLKYHSSGIVHLMFIEIGFLNGWPGAV